MNNMYQQQTQSVGQSTVNAAATNRVLRDTFRLLSFTLLFAAAMGGLNWFLGISIPYFITFIGVLGMSFGAAKTNNANIGIACAFGIAGLLGFGLGPILNMVASSLGNGSQLIAIAFAGTGAIFLGLSWYAMTTKKDFSYLRGFAFALMIALLVGIAVSFFWGGQMIMGLISAGFIVLSSITILMQMSSIVRGGETDYINATITLFISIYNLFVSLLQLLMMFAGED